MSRTYSPCQLRVFLVHRRSLKPRNLLIAYRPSDKDSNRKCYGFIGGASDGRHDWNVMLSIIRRRQRLYSQ